MSLCKFAVAGLMLSAATAALAEDVSITSKGITVQIADNGNYSITEAAPAWQFTGAVGQPVKGLHKQDGSDTVGKFTAATFDFDANGPVTGEIRVYADRPLVKLALTYHSAREKALEFPVLQPPKGLRLFSYGENTFAPPRFRGQSGGSPWLMFDDAGHAAILSPASHFMIASVDIDRTAEERRADEGGSVTSADALRELTDKPIRSGLMAQLSNVPDGFSQSTLLCFGDHIGETWSVWGTAMTDLTGKKRPTNDADPGLKYFGYWTDNGATYYYNYDQKIGYANTLLEVKKAFSELSIPLGYLQLDSWWYIKTSLGPDGKLGKPYKNADLPRGSWNCYGGLTEYKPHPDLFPKGLAPFREAMGIPFITHNRWVGLNSPYREKYKISGVGAIDPKWWDDVATYLKSVGVMTYEQDWLDRIYVNSPEFSSTVTAGDAFMDNMSRATAENGLTLQYCMGLARNYLQGSKYDNLTTVRVSGDRFDRHHWEPALYVSSMAASLGEWPWVDTYMSSETPNMILATLTAGMVGVGDKMGEIDRENIFKAIRADGVIVKPDTSIVPTDQSYIADAANGQDQPMIAAAFTNHDQHRTAYVFAYPRNGKQTRLRFKPADLGFDADVWVYDTQAKTGQKIARGADFSAGFADPSAKTAWAYYVVAPVSASGIALIGDAGKFASAARQRLPMIGDSAEGMKVTVAFAKGDSAVDLVGFAPASPHASDSDGSALTTGFDAGSSQFHVHVEPPKGGSGDVQVTIASGSMK